MRITRRDGDQLILEDAAAIPRFMGAAGIVLGIVFATVLAHGDRAQSWRIVGIAVFVVGAAVLLTTPTTRILIDREKGIVWIRRRSLLSEPRSRLLQLADIERVAVQHVQSPRGGATFRLAFCTRAGATIPWTTYAAAGLRDCERLAEEVNSYLGASDAAIGDY